MTILFQGLNIDEFKFRKQELEWSIGKESLPIFIGIDIKDRHYSMKPKQKLELTTF